MFSIINCDATGSLPILSNSVQCVVTSPPYFQQRRYTKGKEVGREGSFSEYVSCLVLVFREIKRVLKDDGVLWLNLGDKYAKDKNILGLPWRVAFALQEDGWILRQDVIWEKPNGKPESVKDRCTGVHEYLFLFSKQKDYYWDYKAMSEASKTSGKSNSFARKTKYSEGEHGLTPIHRLNRPNVEYSGKRNTRSVWRINTEKMEHKHFAAFPIALPEKCILASTKVGDVVLDPFCGSGTTGIAANRNNRPFMGCDISFGFATIAYDRIRQSMNIPSAIVNNKQDGNIQIPLF